MTNKKIAIIGCGNLGLSILHGLLDTKGISGDQITATKRHIDSISDLKSKGVEVTSDNLKAVQNSEIVILGLKPYNILKVVEQIKPALKKDKHIIISLATAVTLQSLKDHIGDGFKIYRVMPNTAADVSMSITCIASSIDDAESLKHVKACFNSIGHSIVIDESLMDSATVLGACGIAYVLRFIRAMIQGGIQIGFDSKTASTIVTQTVKGAAQLLIEGGNHPEFEIDKVTTPKGCTIAGLNEMEHNGFSSALIKGILTSYETIEK